MHPHHSMDRLLYDFISPVVDPGPILPATCVFIYYVHRSIVCRSCMSMASLLHINIINNVLHTLSCRWSRCHVNVMTFIQLTLSIAHIDTRAPARARTCTCGPSLTCRVVVQRSQLGGQHVLDPVQDPVVGGSERSHDWRWSGQRRRHRERKLVNSSFFSSV